MKKPCSAADPLWYKDAIIYELHVRAFSDSNGDGIGDFQGLISRLDYLQELGVTCLWLLPFFPSPLRDDGYDIAGYTSVNPAYGTLEDFQQFLTEAHARNMQVMIELVINHTSDQHPWFQRARRAPKGSPERDLYVWSDTDQLYHDARIIFTDTEKSNWTWDDIAQQYYWHRFFSHQPDLNFDNPAVMEEVLKAMRFWLDMGVDAMRMDAIPYLIERDDTNCENLPETHAAIKKIRAAIDAEYENRLILAEANQWPADVRPYFGSGDECHMAFHFPLMPRIYMAIRQEDRLPITDIMAQTPDIPPNCQWGIFLRNHDELTLEMVTDDERDYMYLAYSADPRMRINVGIRRRLAPLVDNNRRRIELLNSLLLSFPGTPILYYGDEIGMGDNIYLGDRNGVRTPMQWNSDRNAGFSKAVPARLYFPVIMDPIWGYQAINVEAQQSDPSSLLHWTRNMIALRKLFQVFGRGTLEFLHPENRKVLAYIREYQTTADDPGGPHSETVLCVANLSRFAQPVALDLGKFAGRQPVEMLGYVPFPAIDETPYAITLAPYSFFWLELQPAAPRPEAPQLDTAEAGDAVALPQDSAALPLPHFLEGPGLDSLHSLLPHYLARQRWFGGKSREIRSARLHAATLLHDNDYALTVIEVTYADSAVEFYQLPLATASGPTATDLKQHAPHSILASLGATAVLFDATASEDFRQTLLAFFTSQKTGPLESENLESGNWQSDNLESGPLESGPLESGPLESGPLESGPLKPETHNPDRPTTTPTTAPIAATRSPAFDPASLSNTPSRLGSAEQSNTSILFGEAAILKLFRRLQPGENPDVEITRFLTNVARFEHIPAFLGELHTATAPDVPGPALSLAKDRAPAATEPVTTLAFLQTFAPNEGDGWSWFTDELTRFYESVAASPLPASAEKPASPFFAAVALGENPPAEAPLAETPPADLVPPEIQEHAWLSLDAAALLGTRTAEMHLALATPTADPAFAAETATPNDLASDAQRLREQIEHTLSALKRKLADVPDILADRAALLLSRRASLLDRARALSEDPGPNLGRRIRIHGDYHLGQLLRAKSDFLIVDFEGEPARPLPERRRKQSPLKDVAGMVRSFSYASRAALDRYVQRRPEQQPALSHWASLWESAVSSKFLHAYCDAMRASPGLLPGSRQAEAMLFGFLLEKSLYELLYEWNNRPSWLHIPLDGLLALADTKP